MSINVIGGAVSQGTDLDRNSLIANISGSVANGDAGVIFVDLIKDGIMLVKYSEDVSIKYMATQ